LHSTLFYGPNSIIIESLVPGAVTNESGAPLAGTKGKAEKGDPSAQTGLSRAGGLADRRGPRYVREEVVRREGKDVD